MDPYVEYTNARKNLRKYLFEKNEEILPKDKYEICGNEIYGNKSIKLTPSNRPNPVQPSYNKNRIYSTRCSCGCGHSTITCRIAKRIKNKMDNDDTSYISKRTLSFGNINESKKNEATNHIKRSSV